MNTQQNHNSILSHKQNLRQGIYTTQNLKVLRIIQASKSALSSREIYNRYKSQNRTLIDISSIRRSLTNLTKLELVEIAFSDKCRTTHRKVSHYRIRN